MYEVPSGYGNKLSCEEYFYFVFGVRIRINGRTSIRNTPLNLYHKTYLKYTFPQPILERVFDYQRLEQIFVFS